MNRILVRLIGLGVLLAIATIVWFAQTKGTAEDKFAVTAGFMLLYLPMAVGAWLVLLFGEWLWRQGRGERPSPAIGVLLGIAVGLTLLFALFLFGVA